MQMKQNLIKHGLSENALWKYEFQNYSQAGHKKYRLQNMSFEIVFISIFSLSNR